MRCAPCCLVRSALNGTQAKDMNRSYGFEGEAKHKHGEQTYKARSPSDCTSALVDVIGLAFRACFYDL
jgi:hypothetical protein